MASIIAFFAAQGLSERAAKVAAWIAAALAFAALLAALWGAWGVFDWFNDRDAVEKAVNKANVETLEKAREADDATAAQAGADEILLNQSLEETIDAIENTENGQPSAAAVAHNCQRLRRYGFKQADLPEPCRSGEAAGSEARTDR